MNRVTPERVVEAYRRTGWKPIQDEWFDTVGGQQCGCGLAVLIGSENRLREILLMTGDMEELVADELGLSEKYVAGFIQGFDGGVLLKSEAWDTVDHRIGHQDGRAAWEAVRREVLEDEQVRHTAQESAD